MELDRDQLLPGAERTAEYLPNGVDHRTPLSASGESAGILAEQTAATSSSVLTFPSRAAFLGLPQMRAYLDLSLRLAFRTRESTGLLLYNAGRRSDFLALELADGHLHLVASIGGRIVELKDNYPEGVNDNQWHVLVVARTGKDGQCALTTFLFPFPPRALQTFFFPSIYPSTSPHRYPTHIPNHLFFEDSYWAGFFVLLSRLAVGQMCNVQYTLCIEENLVTQFTVTLPPQHPPVQQLPSVDTHKVPDTKN